jgi:Fe-S cluster assembly iron-binding protein IscA
MSIPLGTIDTFVNMSPAAKKEIKRQLALHSEPDAGVRIHVVIDRYSGYVFDLEFDTPTEDDHQIRVDNIPIFTHKTYMDYVKGMSIDYDPDNHTFSLVNENPSYNCVPGAKFECPTCNLYEERKDDPAYAPEV